MLHKDIPISYQQKFIDLLKEFKPSTTAISLTWHNTDNTQTVSMAQREYRGLKAWEDQFKKELKETGYNEPSTAPLTSPMLANPKKNGDILIDVDYSRLNQVATPDLHVTPRIEYLLDTMGNAKNFTTLDLQKGQVAVNPERTDKTTFVTQWGKFRFKVMTNWSEKCAYDISKIIGPSILSDSRPFCDISKINGHRTALQLTFFMALH